MPEQKIYFVGLLANVDSSISNVKLEHNFEIEAMPEEKGLPFFSLLENLPYYETGRKLFIDFPCLNSLEKKYFTITNSFECEYDVGKEDKLFSKVAEFDNKVVYAYLNPALRLMRLFKEGNILMPLQYFFYLKDDTPHSFMRTGTTRYFSRELYSLEPSEISDLAGFLRSTKLPFADFLELAFENFELSYHTQDTNLSFLVLMTSLETLLNPGGQEVTYTLARNTAVLLGGDKDKSEEIYPIMKRLYGKRSQIVHKGKRIIKQEDLLQLRSYVRESIKEIHKLGKSKKAVLGLLNSLGFGQRP